MGPALVSSTARYAESSSTVSVVNGGGGGGSQSRTDTDTISIRSVALPWASTGVSEMRVTTGSPSATRPQMVWLPSRPGWATTQIRNCSPSLAGLPGTPTDDTVPGVCRSSLGSDATRPRPPRPYSSRRAGSADIGSPPWTMPRATIAWNAVPL